MAIAIRSNLKFQGAPISSLENIFAVFFIQHPVSSFEEPRITLNNYALISEYKSYEEKSTIMDMHITQEQKAKHKEA